MHAKNGVGLACVLGFVFAGVSFGAMIRYVDVSNAVPVAPYTNWSTAATNIQNAINWANSGDLINVRPGVYRTTNAVEIPSGKTLTLRSTTSRAAVLDAQRRSIGLMISSSNSVVEGFTIRNGTNDSYGGGIYMSSPSTVRDCLVVSNQAYGGGGIHMHRCASVVENCTIQYNRAAEIGGGVLFYDHSTGVVNNCIINDNVASNSGGGVYIQYAGSVSNSRISDNWVVSPASGSGGGVSMEHGGRLVNSVVISNSAQFRGGGIHTRYGGYVAHCTVADNKCIGQGGGLWMANDCTTWNNIVYYNIASISNNMWVHSSVVSNSCTTPGLGGSNFTNEPLFVNRNARNFHLAAGSPCIDAGGTHPAVNVDYEGNPRPVAGPGGGQPKYDVGAYEYQTAWDAGYTDIGGGWRRLTWFGDYVPMGDWIFHNKHGFWYPSPSSTPQNIWFYTQDMGWLWTGNATYPFLYRASPAAWLWYNGVTNPRWFRNMTTGQWESRP